VKIQITPPHLAGQLVESLNAAECFAALTGAEAHLVDVFIPWLEQGGDPEQARMELQFFLNAWGMRHPGFKARFAEAVGS
jgi:hypothetical protein